MNAEIIPHYLAIQEIAAKDSGFLEIQAEYQKLDAQLRSALSAMTAKQFDTVMDYLGIRAAMQLRLTELTIEYMLQK